ncbi:P-loop containing nucleoside triphosphate hydrolase protein [Mycena sp. CBHHK59/15]|nr:P-loop containing nucleoside triphosphate hydrolase protein [Mycena sp. CBHHK59/15]
MSVLLHTSPTFTYADQIIYNDYRRQVVGAHSTDDKFAVLREHQADIGFHNATFAWSAETRDADRGFSLQIDNLVFKTGCINLVMGQTGSGKTSLLLALLGEMYLKSSAPDTWFNLPREGGVVYAVQESWVQNDTIKTNIVFNSDFDPERYKKVLYQCCLERDLELFVARDEQIVGERGLTLSGGQKARVTLARALYSPAKILLLDDVLAALEYDTIFIYCLLLMNCPSVHTAKWIVKKCFGGDLIAG